MTSHRLSYRAAPPEPPECQSKIPNYPVVPPPLYDCASTYLYRSTGGGYTDVSFGPSFDLSVYDALDYTFQTFADITPAWRSPVRMRAPYLVAGGITLSFAGDTTHLNTDWKLRSQKNGGYQQNIIQANFMTEYDRAMTWGFTRTSSQTGTLAITLPNLMFEGTWWIKFWVSGQLSGGTLMSGAYPLPFSPGYPPYLTAEFSALYVGWKFIAQCSSATSINPIITLQTL